MMGCAGIIEAWGSAAYSTNERAMYVWGGGHNDYWGNEVYSFEVRDGRWARLTDPSPGDLVKASGVDPLPDGQPNSRHTYDGLEFIDHSGHMFAQGGAISPGGQGTSVTWLFNAETRGWQNTGSKGRPEGYGIASAYDQASGSVLARSTKALWRYQVDTNEWTRLIDFSLRPLWPRYEVSRSKTGEIDTRRRLFWSVGSNDLLVWDIDQGRLVTGDWITTGGGQYTNVQRVRRSIDQLFESGGGNVYDSPAPGFAYDSKADQFVAWTGGAPRILDLKSKKWRTGSAAGAPEAQVLKGTFGRWRYLPNYNVFILINGVKSNVFFYKNMSGGPRVPKSKALPGG